MYIVHSIPKTCVHNMLIEESPCQKNHFFKILSLAKCWQSASYVDILTFIFVFQHQCEFCEKVFRTKGLLINHKSAEHRSETQAIYLMNPP